MLKIHYLCGNKDNRYLTRYDWLGVVICSKFITFAVTKTTRLLVPCRPVCCDLLKIHYLCGNKDNVVFISFFLLDVVICSKFITFAVTKTTLMFADCRNRSCDLLKIHYLCGNKDNPLIRAAVGLNVVICSKFITFAVTKTTFAFIY